jgi:hypothetical protein
VYTYNASYDLLEKWEEIAFNIFAKIFDIGKNTGILFLSA